MSKEIELDLMIEPNILQPDEFYAALVEAHAGLSSEQSVALNARLVLLLANQIGNTDTLRAAIAAARAVSGR